MGKCVSISMDGLDQPMNRSIAFQQGFGRLAVDKARERLEQGKSALDAVEAGVNAVEIDNQEQYYVGYGGFPNAAGVMELDAAVMEGTRRCVPGDNRLPVHAFL